jgi:hypothetical protein
LLFFFFGLDFVEDEDDFFFGGGERREDDFLTGALFRFFDFGLSESSESTSENSSEISLSTLESSESSSIISSSSSESIPNEQDRDESVSEENAHSYLGSFDSRWNRKKKRDCEPHSNRAPTVAFLHNANQLFFFLLPSCFRERPLPGNFDFETGFDLWLLLDEDLGLAASGFFVGAAAGLAERESQTNKKRRRESE